ncbi:MAG: tetraacyldisaccharide 4'-kinase [Candidatus Omnitrophica bacterium]|nr:tetraacyldisaccharide 4'-kinase [Candidatus Omnitrophota bacterium]
MRNFIYSLMTDKRSGPVVAPLKFLLYLASFCYGIAIYIRRLLYKYGIFRAGRVPMKVISVGNLTLGGTGKTPFVIWLARMLNDELNKTVSILIRGYGWDEQNMLKKKVSDIPILAGENRARSCHKAIRLYGSNTAVLDDGFQHWELARNLDIVLIDSRNPFGNGRLFPRGILREPIEAVNRADVIVLTKVDKKKAGLDIVKSELKRIKSDLVFLESAHRPKYIYDQRNRVELPLSYLNKKRLILLSGIGDPSYFEETVRGLGADIAEHIVFSDHHNYNQEDMARILKRCDERKFDFVLMTEKDEVKIRRMSLSFGKYIPMTLVIEIDIIAGKEQLVARLTGLYNRKAFK